VTDIFISYAREDRDVAGRIAEALTERGFKVWWDWELIGGDNYRFKIREVIGEAKKSIVLWSRHSIMSAFVIDEASEAKKHGKLIPVSIDGSDPPFGFGDLHTIALDAPRIDVEALVAALEGKAPPREQDLRKARRGLGLPKIAAVAAACLIAAVGAYWSWSRTQATLTQEPVRQAEKPATPQAFTSRIALVVGNRAYKELPVIENAVRDADLVSAELQRRGFKVIKQLDLTAEEMTRAFKDFETLLSVVGGVGVFYYAGSAVYIDGEDILLPIDATADTQNRRIRNSVNVTQLQKEIKSRSTTAMRDNGHAVLYSASKGEFAADGPTGGNSPFTTAFVEALKHADDDLSDTYRRIRNALAEDQRINSLAIKQTPYFENQLGEKFLFGRPEQDTQSGISKILLLDSCRDNPFKLEIATK
jgi:hypothetical protein